VAQLLKVMSCLTIKGRFCGSGALAGIELMRRIYKGQFNIGKLRIEGTTTPAIWNAVLAA
jgi:hypothetical protein